MMRACGMTIAVVLAVAGSARAQSTARTVRIASEQIGQRTVAVLLPADYEQTDKRYPVLYLLHGGGQDHTAFMARRDFARRARTVEMIVVMPAADRGGMTPRAVTQYEDFIARELVAYIDANYRSIGTPPGRAIAGLSMGGMVAAGAGLRYPQVFGTIGAFSPAAPRSELPAAADAVMPNQAAQYFYVSCGTLDSLVPASRQLVMLLKGRGIGHEYHEIPGFGHAWDFWDPQIDTFIRFLSTTRGWRIH
jgi:enterochelin esterase-like enzyme